jgi:hypothetical protein
MCLLFSYNSSIAFTFFLFSFQGFLQQLQWNGFHLSCFRVFYCVYLGVCMRESDLFAGLGQ